MKQIIILPIEPIDARYTAEWYTHIPVQLVAYADSCGVDVKVDTIDGEEVSSVVPEGTFLDWTSTNIYKSSQLIAFANKLRRGEVLYGANIVVTDAWNPAVLQIRYMLDLLGRHDVKLHGLWHAGSYDKSDILGFTIKDKRWSFSTERALYFAFDHNYFASEYHRSMFLRELDIQVKEEDRDSVLGWPMEYIRSKATNTEVKVAKEKLVLFPHRISSDKQPWIFDEIAVDMSTLAPEYSFVKTQPLGLSKGEYHKLLGRAEFVFSCSLHENLGIGMYEGSVYDAVPLLPNRLSYKEMYDGAFLYPPEWTESTQAFAIHRSKLYSWILDAMRSRETLLAQMHSTSKSLDVFFSGEALYKNLVSK